MEVRTAGVHCIVPRVCACILVGMFGMSAMADDRDSSSDVILVDGPTVIGFASSSLASAADTLAFASSAIAHLQFALAGVAECLETIDPAIEQKFVDVVVWESEGKRSRLDLSGELGEQLGVILVSPGAAPRVIYATVGPSSLPYLVSTAAADYFHVVGCEVEL